MGVLDLAAGAEDEGEMRPAMLERLPMSFDPAARFRGRRMCGAGESERVPTHFERPEGSFAARSFGNAVHAFLEMAAGRLQAGVPEGELALEVVRWRDRASSVLRSDGLPPAVVERLAARVVLALTNTLGDPVGRWLLGRRKDARSEYALTVWTERWSRVRMDRVFRAGASPGAEGEEFLWIVDYKTGSHGAEGVEVFLERERERYAGQMEGYARASGAEGGAGGALVSAGGAAGLVGGGGIAGDRSLRRGSFV